MLPLFPISKFKETTQLTELKNKSVIHKHTWLRTHTKSQADKCYFLFGFSICLIWNIWKIWNWRKSKNKLFFSKMEIEEGKECKKVTKIISWCVFYTNLWLLTLKSSFHSRIDDELIFRYQASKRVSIFGD